jgi:single-strand DNA-binding protein
MIIVQVAGRLGKDAETRFTPSGQKVTTLTLAANTRKAGKEETVWWRVTIWGERYDKVIPYWKKGAALIAIGEMHKPEIWTDREGRPQPSVEMTADIIRFNPFGGSSDGANQKPGTTQATYQNQGTAGRQDSADFDQTMQSGAGAYAHANPAEEPLPF